jgi:Mn2+/Fe2+ NRAMP family transporter
LTAPVLIGIILHICNNKSIMGQFTNSKFTNVIGLITLMIMSAAAMALLYLELVSS